MGSSVLIGPYRNAYAGDPYVYNVKPTGRRHWVEVSLPWKDNTANDRERFWHWSFVRVVDGLPKGAKVRWDGDTFDDPAPPYAFGTLSERKRTGSWLMTALSYPLSYVVDPVCTAIPTAVTFTTSYLGVMAAAPIISIVDEWGPHDESEWVEKVYPKPTPAIQCRQRGTSFVFQRGDGPELCAPMLAERIDKSRTYKLYARYLTPEQARAAARKLQEAGIKVDTILYGDCTVDEMIRLGGEYE